MSLTFKSNMASTVINRTPEFLAYKARVLADGGVIKNEQMVSDAFSFMSRNNLGADNIMSATSANWGVKESGGNVLGLYSLFGYNGDLVTVSGSFQLQESGGKFSFYAGESHNKMVSQKSTPGITAQSFFQNYHPASFSSSEAYGVVFETTASTVGTGGVGINAVYEKTGVFSANGFGVSGSLADIPKSNDISFSVSADGFFAYQDGAVVAEDLDIVPPAPTDYKLVIAAQDVATRISAVGNYYASIYGANLSEKQNKALSSFVAAIA